MSPEQLRGDYQSVAADVYGLGMVLFEMLLPEYTPSDRAVFEVVLGRSARDMVVPSQARIPAPVAALINSMLRLEPDQRASLEEVLATLRDMLGQRAIDQPDPVRAWSFERSRAMRGLPLLIAISTVVVVSAIFLVTRSVWSATLTRLTLAVVSGMAIAGAGIAVAYFTRRIAASRRPELQDEAVKVVLGAQSREALTRTLAIQVDHLVERCRAMGEEYWGQTVALMLKEYEDAREAKDRREALMNVVTLLEKVTARLSPWWVRHDKALAAGLTLVGIGGGLWKIASDIISLSAGN
jgi:hypothetical protein